ncbi:GNAT family N-acetyltransferase [Clavibacter tessellarius]|uniref:GNAT family N-acetyltransferase n=1 Tax=Clavibacter tessellarius TaxID=31965 RepID=UPI0032551938
MWAAQGRADPRCSSRGTATGRSDPASSTPAAPCPSCGTCGWTRPRGGRGVGTAIIRAAEERVTPGRLTVGVGLDNPRARALYEAARLPRHGEMTTTSYAYVDDAGATRQATETDETLARDLG